MLPTVNCNVTIVNEFLIPSILSAQLGTKRRRLKAERFERKCCLHLFELSGRRYLYIRRRLVGRYAFQTK